MWLHKIESLKKCFNPDVLEERDFFIILRTEHSALNCKIFACMQNGIKFETASSLWQGCQIVFIQHTKTR
jgi:hypothetical protein